MTDFTCDEMFFDLLKLIALQLAIEISVQPFGDVVRHVQPPIKTIVVPILLSINCAHNSNVTSQFQRVYRVLRKSPGTTCLHTLSVPTQRGSHLAGTKWLFAQAVLFPVARPEIPDPADHRSNSIPRCRWAEFVSPCAAYPARR